ncbi:Fc.00g068990.m01.CDS01 [Cosmosporella sp. VM-42]
MALVESTSLNSCTHATSIPRSRDPSWTSQDEPNPVSSTRIHEDPMGFHQMLAELDALRLAGIDALTALEEKDASGHILEPPIDSHDRRVPFPPLSIDYLRGLNAESEGIKDQEPKSPFHRWVRSLRKRAVQRPTCWDKKNPESIWELLNGKDSLIEPPLRPSRSSRKSRADKSSSDSSSRFITAVRSASISLASASVLARSRRNNSRSHGLSRTDGSSAASIRGPRFSEDSMASERPTVLVDMATVQRSLQRRRILEELVTTEENYIGDVRFLMNVYLSILAGLPNLSIRLRQSINKNLTEIVALHDEILGELHRVIPDSEYSQLHLSMAKEKAPKFEQGHFRGHSLDVVPELGNGASWLHNVPGMVSEPQVVAEVAKVFVDKMSRFFIYKEYGAKYEMMIQDIASTHEAMPGWEFKQRGLETLASSVRSIRSSMDKTKKGLTVGDLLVKPIQRMCRYPLLFAELLKYTPASDCPHSHMEVEIALTRLREATAMINRATDDDSIKATLEKTWALQDRLVFPNRKLDAASKHEIRAYGHAQMCGALHCCWQTEDGVDGQYMICLLYKELMVLACAGKVDPIYTIQACINLNGATVEDVDNGRGLQCQTAPFSWKLLFEKDYQMYEMIMTACTSKEETVWRERLRRPIYPDGVTGDLNLHSFLALEMKSLGSVFGRPGTVARRISIHRATTVGPKSPLYQVILKNTSNSRTASNRMLSPRAVKRSKSLRSTTPRTPILTPPRSQRVRIENLTADIWSREILPFPGMPTRARSEHLVLVSASTMMRKLSVRSIGNSKGKRSSDAMHRTRSNEEEGITEEPAPSTGNSGDDCIDCGESRQLDTIQDTKDLETLEATDGDIYEKDSSVRELELVDVSEVAQKLDLVDILVERDEEKLSMEEETNRAVLRSSTTNSLRRSASGISEKSVPLPGDKENTYRSTSDVTRSYSLRWARNGSLRSDGKSHGFRSLFR